MPGWPPKDHGIAQNTFVVALGLERQGDFESARGALLSFVSFEDPEWSPRAAVTLGEMLWQRGDVVRRGRLRTSELGRRGLADPRRDLCVP